MPGAADDAVQFIDLQGEERLFEELAAAFPVTMLCRVLGVSRAGFYATQHRPVAARVTLDARLAVQIAAIHQESRRRYGSPPVHAAG